MNKNEDKGKELNRALEPIVTILIALLKEGSPAKKIDQLTKKKLVLSLIAAGYSQEKIASLAGMSLTDVNKFSKGK